MRRRPRGCGRREGRVAPGIGRTAKLAFDQMDLDHPEKDALTWERAIRKLRGGMMPPPGMPKPPLEAVNALATYLETSLDKAGAVQVLRLVLAALATGGQSYG